jgi:trimeric autotransporter adhesin
MNKISTLFLVFLCVCGYVDAQPTISGVSPMKGHPGSTVTISGANFNTTPANNIVYFGATRATVTAAAATSLTATVPVGATYNEVSVNNTATSLTAYSQYPFLPTYDNSVYLSGVVNFATRSSFTAGSNPAAVAIGDIDCDGKADIVVGHAGTNSISVFRNISAVGSIAAGSFASPVTFTIGSGTSCVAIGDLDGDGKPDLVATNTDLGTISVLRNTSTPGSITTGSLAPHVLFTTSGRPLKAAIGDIDGDGKPELVVTDYYSNNVSVLRNTSVVGSVTVASFAPKVDFATGNGPIGVAIGDIDGDAKPDLAVANASGSVSVFRNSSSIGSITSSSFASHVVFAAGAGAEGVSMGDIDIDGKPDIVVVNSTANTVSVFRNTSTIGSIAGSSFAAQVVFAVGNSPRMAAIGDIDGDGKPDMAINCFNPGNVYVFRNISTTGTINTGSFAAGVPFFAGSALFGVAMGDIDGDSKPELVVPNYSSSTFSVLSNNPLASITGNPIICVGATSALSSATTGGTWSSSAPGKATVDSVTGIVTGVSEGPATITYTVAGGYTTIEVGIKPLPAVGIITEASVLCEGGTTKLSGTGAASYSWSGGVSDGVPFAPPVGFPTYTVIGTQGTCTNAATITLTVNALPTVVAMVTATTICEGNSVIFSGSGASSYSWTGGVTNGIYFKPPVGTHIYTVTGTATTGCKNKATATVTVLPRYIFTSSAGPNGTISPIGTVSVCTGESKVYTITPNSGYHIEDVIVDGSSVGAVSSYTLTATAAHTIHATFLTNCSAPPPVTGTLSLCVGGVTGFSHPFAGGTWSSSDPETADIDEETGMLTGIRAGTATITYAPCPEYFTTVTVTVNPMPSSISGNGSFCVGGTLTLSNSVSGGTWNSGNTARATVDAATGVVTGASTGTADISYTLAGGCRRKVVVTVSAAPGAISGGTTSLCEGASVTLSCSPGGGTWSSADPSIATVNSTGTVTAVAAGTVIVSYIKSAGCWSLRTITVNQLPSAIAGNTAPCAGSTAMLSSTPAGGTWSSNSIARATINTFTGLLTGVSAGTAIITYTAGGCRRTIVATVNALPATITGSYLGGALRVCQGNSAFISNSTAGGTWSIGNSEVATIDSSGLLTGVASGTTTVSYTIGECVRTAPVLITNVMPQIYGDTVGCVGGDNHLYNTFAGGTWTSSNIGVASFISGGSPASERYNGVSVGTAIITYVPVPGCLTTIQIRVDSTFPTITGPSTACVGASTALSAATRAGAIWTSIYPHIAVINSETGLLSGISAGVVRIYYRIGLGCSSSRFITVNATPGTIAGTAAVCTGATTTLSCSPGGGTWSSDNTAIATISTTGLVTGVSPGTAIISYTNSSSCRSVRIVTVNEVPSAITGPSITCSNNTELFTASPDGGTWSASHFDIVINPSTGLYTGGSPRTTAINYTLPNGCRSTHPLTINFTPPVFTCNTSTVVGGSIVLTNGMSGGTWTSSNNTVATVGTAYGVFGATMAGMSVGTTTISYIAGGCLRTVVGSVSAAIADITGTPVVCVGQTNATLGHPVAGGTWSSSPTSIATVHAATGLLTGVGAGTARVTYTLSPGISTSLVVTVTAALPAITGTLIVCPASTTTLSHSTGGGTWSSSNTTTATIDAVSGLVSGVTAGTTVITYSSGAGCYKTAVFTVATGPGSITATGSAALCAGTTITLSCSPGGGTWSSDNTAIATISTAGLVTGVSSGTATITYTNSSSCRSTRVVTVNALPSAITGPSAMCALTSSSFSATPSGGTWSLPTYWAGVDAATGYVSVYAAGTAVLSYTLPTGCRSTHALTMLYTPTILSGLGITFVGAATTLSCGYSAGIWSSSNPAIASVGAGTGIVSGVSVGTATISYSAGSCARTRVVTVNAPIAASFGTPVVCVGQTNATLGNPVAGGTWSSSATSIATVHAATGLLTGIGAGTANITYTLSPGMYTIMIATVSAALPANAGTTAICTGATTTLTNAAGGGTWSSSNTLTATVVTGTGVVTGVTGGTATISYSVNVGCYRVSTVTINSAPNISGVTSVVNGGLRRLNGSPGGGTWSSANAAVATVSGFGYVSGHSIGFTTVTYTLSTTGCFRTYPMMVFAARPGDADATVPEAVKELKVYPNPSSGMLTIDAPVAGAFTVYTIDGRQVAQYSVAASANRISLPQQLAAGVYMCRFAGADGSTAIVRLVYEP